MFFKGYVKTKNKKCIEKFKDRTDLKTLEQVANFPEYAGVLDKDTVLVDVDDFEQSEILFEIVQAENLACRVYKTSRGKHFLFKVGELKSNKTRAQLAIGLTADMKLGKNNSYEVLKFDGEERPILYDCKEAAVIPYFLFPVNSSVNFLELGKGDGRNQALFNYILALQSANFTKEKIRETIRLINRFILKNPLGETEIETILRDEAFAKPVFFKGNAFLFDKFANFLKNNAHIIKINNQLHIYDDGVFVGSGLRIENEMIKHIPELNRAKRKEVYDYLNVTILNSVVPQNANLIAFRNGVYNIINDQLTDYTPDNIILNRIEWDYNPNAYSKLADDTLNKIACNDKTIRALLEEAIGYCFYRRNELGKAFILTGDRSNGKSTFLDMVKNVLGENNVSSLDLNELNKDFHNAELFGKLANIGDDISDEFIPNTSIFKKLVTGDRMTIRRIYGEPFSFNNYCKFLFSANDIPRLGKGKDSSAIARRLVIIPFEAHFSNTDPDFNPYIKYELQVQEVMEYLILLGIQGLKRVLANRQFTQSSKAQRQLEEYEERNNPILVFFNEVPFEEIENQPTNEVYKRYDLFCAENNFNALGAIEFSRQVKKFFNCLIVDKCVQGKKRRIFVKGDQK